ncbi:MAG TPA: hypothetical protein VI299_25125 [Polyangiales bacterium]
MRLQERLGTNIPRLLNKHLALAVACGLGLSSGVSGCVSQPQGSEPQDAEPLDSGAPSAKPSVPGKTPSPGDSSAIPPDASDASKTSDRSPSTPVTPASTLPVSPLDPNAPLYRLPTGEAARQALCSRAANEGRQDKVIQTFCDDAPPTVTSLKQLQSALKIDTTTIDFALSAHSTSLSVRNTSAINPRAILFQGSGSDLLTLGYTRGEQAAEIIVRDANSNNLNFYVGAYTQPCNASHNCAPADLLTPTTESDWVEFSLYPSEDLENTEFDCNSCHLVGNQRILRLQEFQSPWMHWLSLSTREGNELLDDFHAAHGMAEEYAGIPGSRISSANMLEFEVFLSQNGFGTQPNEFPPQELDSAGMKKWNRNHLNSLQGKAIPVPYFKAHVSDPDKLSAMTSAYAAYMSGSSTDLPDIRDLFLTQDLDKMGGIHVPSQLTGQELVTAACSQCHDDRLNQTITRARFNVDLAKFSDLKGGVLVGADRDVGLARAIARVRLPETDIAHMPPARVRSLSSSQVDALVAYFCSQMSQPSAECP